MPVNSSNKNNQRSYSDFYKSDFLKRFREVNPAYGLNNEDVNTDEKLWNYLLKMKPSLEDAQFKNDILPDRSQGSIEATNIYLNEFSKDSTNNEKPSIYEMISGPMQESINESVFKETAKIEQIEQKEADEKVDIQNMMDRRTALVDRKEPIVKVEGIKNHLGGPVSVAKPLANKISTASDVLAEKGIKLDIMDSTVREEDKLKSYLEYVEGGRKGPKKSHPDTSFHTIGYAVDLANTPEMKNEEVFNALKSVGLTQHEDEWWHFSYDPQEEKKVEDKQPTFEEREELLKAKEYVPHVYSNSAVRRHAQGLYTDFEKRLMSEFGRDIMKDVSKQAGVEGLPELNRVQHFIGYTIDNSFMGEAVKWMLTPLTGDPKEYWMYQYWGQTKSAKEYAENMNTLEQIGSAVFGFLLPLDKLAFVKGGKFAYSGLAVAKKRLVKMLTDRGLPLGVANQVANSSKHHLWERMIRTGGAIATHGTATSVMRDMNHYMGTPKDTRPEKRDSAKKYVSEFTKSFLVGGTASFAGHHVGRIDHAGLQAAMRGHGGKVADFLTEVLVFSTVGTAVHDPSGVAKAYEQEELMDMWWESFVHTAGLMLALKYIHSLEGSDYPSKVKLKKGDGEKLQEQLKSEIDLKN